MDFTNKFSDQILIDEGFDDNKKTFFSLFGVSYYLTKEEISSLLNYLFAKSLKEAQSFLIMQTKNFLKKKEYLIELKIC